MPFKEYKTCKVSKGTFYTTYMRHQGTGTERSISQGWTVALFWWAISASLK